MDHIGLEPLNPHEYIVLERMEHGAIAEFDRQAADRPRIRASLVRGLLLAAAAQQTRGALPSGTAGVRIRGAVIHGPLELDDDASGLGGLPVLALENCEIENDINLSCAHLSRLSLKGSRVRFVNLREALVDGPVELSGIGGFSNDPCWIDARGAMIHGDITASASQFRAPAARAEPIGDGDRQAALWLAGATIQGSIRLLDGFVAHGGVSLDTARVQGDVRVDGATFTFGEGDAFNARSATIGGVLYMRNAKLKGVAWLTGVRVNGALEISDTTICGEIDRWEKRRAEETRTQPVLVRKAVALADADIGTALRLSPGFTAFGSVDVSAARIRGNLNAEAAKLDNRNEDRRSRTLHAANVEIGGNLLLDGTVISGRIDLAGARIGGKLSLLGACGNNRNDDGSAPVLEAINVTIGGNLEFGRSPPDYPARGGSNWYGVVNLTGSTIGGDLSFSASRVLNQPVSAKDGVAIIARRVVVRGSVMFDAGFQAQGAVLLSGMTVGRDLRCKEASFANDGASALYAKDAEIGDDVELEDCTIRGHLRFRRIMVTGSFLWKQLTLNAGAPGCGARLDLSHARIRTRLVCTGIISSSPYRIDLTAAEVATILIDGHDHATHTGVPNTDRPIWLDGLRYDRIEVPDGATGRSYRPDFPLWQSVGIPSRFGLRWLLPKDQLANRLLDWLARESVRTVVDFGDDQPRARPRSRTFRPQPYRMLGTVLRAQGRDETARAVAVAERWLRLREECRQPVRRGVVGWRVRALLQWIFGLGWGFGLRPGSAVVTLLLYIGLGWGLAYLAIQRHWLVEMPHLAANAYAWQDGAPQRAFPMQTGTTTTLPELPCHDLNSVADAVVYAMDTVLPFIPLHQVEKCELNPEFHWLRLGSAFYTLFGWVVTSLSLLTLAGILKRFERDSE